MSCRTYIASMPLISKSLACLKIQRNSCFRGEHLQRNNIDNNQRLRSTWIDIDHTKDGEPE